MLVAVAIFLVICSAIFSLISISQTRFTAESGFEDTFQSGRTALDQMIRDVHNAGYPPANLFTPATGNATPQLVAMPFAWMPNYPATPCTLASNCTSPTGFDIIVETNVDPQSSSSVEWVRYRLNGTTLERGQATKNLAAGHDPVTDTGAVMTTFVENVMNNPGASTITAIQKVYPTLFPGNVAVPVFTYTIDSGANSDPTNIREVNITLILQAPFADSSTNQKRMVALTGQARRENPRK